MGKTERGEISTTIDPIEKIAKALKANPVQLFDFSDIIV